MDNLQSQTPKEAAWRSRLQRHAQSGKSIAAFCRDEAVSTASFHIWRAKLPLLAGPRPHSQQRSLTSAPSRMELASRQSAFTSIGAGAASRSRRSD